LNHPKNGSKKEPTSEKTTLKEHSSYIYSFNRKETDTETDLQDYGMRIYNPSLGKFLSVGPIAKQFPWWSPYHYAGNTPIQAIDLDGSEPQSVAVKRNDGKTHLTVPVIAMFAKLYGETYWNNGSLVNIKIDQPFHDKLTGYQSGAITLGFEMIFTQNYTTASTERWLKSISHEIVHVQQFSGLFGSRFPSQQEYNTAVTIWAEAYAITALCVALQEKTVDKSQIHESMLIESQANQQEERFRKFYDSQNFVRKRNVNGRIVAIKSNRVDNLLGTMVDAQMKTAKTDAEKQKQINRYRANYNSLIKLVDDFNQKEEEAAAKEKKNN
jgi:RHS repeat-associated protein